MYGYSIPMGRITGHFSPYKDSRVILVVLIVSLIVFGTVFIYRKRRSIKAEERTKNNLVQLELLDRYNRTLVVNINRGDIPVSYVADVADIVSIAEYNTRFNIRTRCFAIKYGGKYVGIISAGKPHESTFAASEINRENYFRIDGFVIDVKYRHIGIGTIALKKAIQQICRDYGNVNFLVECHKDNEKAIRFFEKNGFVNTGKLNAKGTDYFMILK